MFDVLQNKMDKRSPIVSDIRDVLSFAGNIVPGESTASFGTTTSSASRLRGFATTHNLIDGFAVSNRRHHVVPNSIERVEVVKGPASFLYGSIPPGGIVYPPFGELKRTCLRSKDGFDFK